MHISFRSWLKYQVASGHIVVDRAAEAPCQFLVWETAYAHDHISSSSHDIGPCTSPVLLQVTLPHAAADLGVLLRWWSQAEPHAVQHSTQAGVTGAGELLQQLLPALTACLLPGTAALGQGDPYIHTHHPLLTA